MESGTMRNRISRHDCGFWVQVAKQPIFNAGRLSCRHRNLSSWLGGGIFVQGGFTCNLFFFLMSDSLPSLSDERFREATKESHVRL
ncbi:uncharacterized protein BT62DRAFT_576842 [Guyanagaster necrorhizus]|uniref:Uncharacterized protein n=1 Tax=Guyanagaster necrorhizus TaxID=856835 RepID=A0A9P7VHC7_9AGAR|nr:uncharacterized protein BT62DRAFT_576842 [Guyanagaster necrorhizus MCA 3950]KAG7440577.1 hypothetical protein BT62DRAFT_576842 [Guyanagaster necrorhizus MCA 3950]